ncbi:M48 family metallopeptidase [bacterium]|nr:M48 family metallopeptidase [bacterium]
MNIFGVIILATMVGKFLLDMIALWLNLRLLNAHAPSQFSDLYDPEQYARSQEYTRVTTRFHVKETTFHLAVFLIFWFVGGFNWLDQIVRSWGYGSIASGICYIFLLGFAGGLLSLPFDFYKTFVIEEEFGFNRTTLRIFILDRLKGLLIAILLGVPLLAVLLSFFESSEDLAWLYAWFFATAYILFVQFIYPVWIMPLFLKFTPLTDGDLKQAIKDYAASVGFAFKDVYVVDASKRSSKANAFFIGFGKNKRIALFDTLVEQQTVPEVVAVLAHEIGHYQKKHVPIMMAVGILQSFVLFYLMSVFLSSPGLYEAFHMDQRSIYAGLVFFGMLYEPISFVSSIVMNVVSRRNELQADQYAVSTLGDAQNLISALKKLSVKNLSNLTPHPLHVFLNYSHPPLAQRIERMDRMGRAQT